MIVLVRLGVCGHPPQRHTAASTARIGNRIEPHAHAARRHGATPRTCVRHLHAHKQHIVLECM